MNTSLKLPAIMIAVGLVLALIACLVTGIVLEPIITEHDFNYSVTYQLNGETKTLNGVYKCKYDGRGTEDPLNRYYSGEYVVDGQSTYSHSHTIAREDGFELYIVTLFNDSYLMGDTNSGNYDLIQYDPFLEAVDKNSMQYGEEEIPDVFDAKIISWEYPEPIENTFTFRGFSILHVGSMLAMLAVGLLVIVACLVFVKRDKSVAYKLLDKVSVVLNWAVCLLAIPFMTVATSLLQLTINGDSFVYQLYLCLPALSAFTVGASIALRRRGYTKLGLFIQLAGPVIFYVPVFLESIGI